MSWATEGELHGVVRDVLGRGKLTLEQKVGSVRGMAGIMGMTKMDARRDLVDTFFGDEIYRMEMRLTLELIEEDLSVALLSGSEYIRTLAEYIGRNDEVLNTAG